MEKEKLISSLKASYQAGDVWIEMAAWIRYDMDTDEKAETLADFLTRIIRDSGIPTAKVTDKIIINLGLVECYANGADI